MNEYERFWVCALVGCIATWALFIIGLLWALGCL